MGENLQDHPNWNAVLQWSLRVQEEGGVPNTNLTPLDEERREFLRSALSEAAANTMDPVRQMRQHLAVIKNTESSNEECIDALEELAFHAEDLDDANDLYLIGGLHTVTAYLKHDNPDLQWRSAEVIANATQNNEKVLKFVIENSVLNILLQLVDESSIDMVRVKSMYAISCLIRGHKEAQDKFNSLEGYNVLIRALQSNIDKLQIKVMFLTRDICTVSPEQIPAYLSMGLVDELFVMVNKQPWDMINQQAILLLGVLHKDHQQHMSFSKEQLQILDNALPAIEETYKEERAVCKKLLASHSHSPNNIER